MNFKINDALCFSLNKRDNEILLSYVLNRPRSFLYAHPEKELSQHEEDFFKKLIIRRKRGEPIPYIIGYQEFWSLEFKVTPETLIPRPETELLVETILDLFPKEKKILADLGTGTGCIALALAHERPQWEIHAVDKNQNALAVAKENAKYLKITNCKFHLGEWCAGLPNIQFDVVVSNPPYISENDSHLSETVSQFEPKSALISGVNGLDDIQKIIAEAKYFLKPQGMLMLEHGFNQGESVRKLMKNAGYQNIQTKKDFAGHNRLTYAIFNNPN